MIKATGSAFFTTGDDDDLHGALAGDAIGANRKLYRVDAFFVSVEAGRCGCRIQQNGIAGVRFMGKRPVVC